MNEILDYPSIEAAAEACRRFGEAAHLAGHAFQEFGLAYRNADRQERLLGKYRAQMRLKLRGKNWRAAK